MNLKLIIFFSFLSLFSSYNNKEVQFFDTKIYEYQDTSGYLTITLMNEQKDFIQGKHCFVVLNGDKIDCCDSISIEIFLAENNEYEGFIKSCYDDEKYRIRVLFIENYFIFSFTEDIHPFLPKSINFYKKKEKRE